MGEFMSVFYPPLIIGVIILWILILLVWLFFNHGIDKLRHPGRWRNAGSSGEQIMYLTLTKKYHIPEQQILRNIHIPKANGDTTEIDLLVVSTRGLLVFECKNYAGHIYGDAKRKQWVQYLGRKKSYFYNPFMQNRGHVKYLRAYLAKCGIDVDNLPITPMVVTITRGKWKVWNYGPEDYLLGYNCKLKGILDQLPVCVDVRDIKSVLSKLSNLQN